METLKRIFLGGVVVSLFSFAGPALAGTPYLSVSNEGGYDNVRISISNANPYSQITLYRRQGTSLWTTITNFGQTDGSGYYSTTVSLGGDGSNNPVEQYVVVAGLQSSTVSTYPYGGGNNCYGNNCGNYGDISFSETTPSLSVGQSRSISIYHTYSGNYYVSSNSNSSVVSASVSGATLNLYAYQNGSATITVCQSGYSSSCGSVYVTVSGGTVGNITFSPQNPNINVGESMNVYVSAPYIYSGSYYVSSNSNSNAVSASVSGSTVSLYGKASGNSTITVCQSGSSSSCGSLYVTVSGGGSYGNITFSETNPYLSVGQSRNISIYDNYYNSGSGNYYVSSNSNSNVVSASVSGTTLNLYAYQNGSATVTVCQSGYSSSCGSVYVTVSGSGGNYGNVTFSQNYPNLNINQSMNVYVYGSSGYSGNYYVSSNSNSNVVSVSISGSTLNLYGRSYGNSTITVCQSGYSNVCGTLYVNVGGGGSYGNITLSQTSLSLSAGQSSAINIYGSSSGYYVSSNSNSSVASAGISGSTLTVYGYQSGSSTVTVCQTGSYSGSGQCATLYVSVGGNYGGGYLSITTTSLPVLVIGQYYSHQLTASGGVPPYKYEMISGAFPAGLSLSESGLLSGIPQYAVTANFGVRVRDNQQRTGTAYFTISPSGSSGGVAGTSTYNSGRLIKENGTVYIVYKNTKTGFANAAAFTGLGFSFGNVSDIGVSGLTSSGYVVTISRASHPWGSWVKSGQTVYFVHELGLIPVPSMSVFTNNGGQENYIVPANSYDFSLPILSPMALNDSRLR